MRSVTMRLLEAEARIEELGKELQRSRNELERKTIIVNAYTRVPLKNIPPRPPCLERMEYHAQYNRSGMLRDIVPVRYADG